MSYSSSANSQFSFFKKFGDRSRNFHKRILRIGRARKWHFVFFDFGHELQTPCEEWPKIHSYSQICRCGQSIFCLSHRPKFSDFFNLYLHWVSIVCDFSYWNTVFPPIVSLETTVFWKWRMWKFSYSFHIMGLCQFFT